MQFACVCVDMIVLVMVFCFSFTILFRTQSIIEIDWEIYLETTYIYLFRNINKSSFLSFSNILIQFKRQKYSENQVLLPGHLCLLFTEGKQETILYWYLFIYHYKEKKRFCAFWRIAFIIFDMFRKLVDNNNKKKTFTYFVNSFISCCNYNWNKYL